MQIFSKFDLTPLQTIVVAGSLLFMAVSTYSVTHFIEDHYQTALTHELTSLLSAATESTLVWNKEQQLLIQRLARDDHVVDITRQLLILPRQQAALLAAPEQEVMSREMHSYLDFGIYEGYFIIAPDGVNLASAHEVKVGETNLIYSYPRIVDQLWNGKTLLTPIQRADVPLQKQRQGEVTDNETMFVATPIRDENGSVIALLALRINPYKSLFPIMEHARFALTGDSYIFNREGRMLSMSRFNEDLARIGVIKPWESSASNALLVDPGYDLTKADGVRPATGKLPLTRMAASAINGQDGIDLEGYRDFRGVPVIGVWHWDKELGFGFAVEQEVSEAYSLFYFVRMTIFVGAIGMALILIGLVMVIGSGKRKVERFQKQLQSIVETASDGIVVINKHGLIESVNPAMLTIFGYPPDSLIGRKINILMPEPYRSQHDTHLEKYLQGCDSLVIGFMIEREGCRSSGETFPMELCVNRLELDTGLYFSGVVRDISERKKGEQALIMAREEAVEANRAKSTFLATMSHEIRTPLYGVVGTVDMLAHTKLDSAQKDLVTTAKDSAVLLQGIIDDILDFSKIEAGRLELEQLPLSLELLVEKLGDSLHHLAVKRGVELLIYCDPWLPAVKGDSVRLRQILYNLAGNSIKFSSNLDGRSGQVVVRVLQKNQEDGLVNICLQVSDNGIGMSTEVQKRLFMPFVQGEEHTTRRFGGTGLGLVITERLVDMMGGDIKVDSSEGYGSSFSVYLSLEKVDEVTEVEEPGTSDLSGLKVVLVHANDEVSWVLKNYLQYAGAEVILATYDEVIELCRNNCSGIKDPLVVIDTKGEEALSQTLRDKIRSVIKDVEIRFVLVDRGQRRYARMQDGDSLVLDLNAMRRATLLNAVAAVTGRESPIRESAQPQEVVQSIALTVEEAREKGRLILLADDNETNRKLISQQLQMLGFLAESAKDGQQALTMWHSGDYAMLMTDCHMPEMDGYQLSASVRQQETLDQRLPIIAITADAMKGTAEKCIASGMDDYMTKPLQLHQLQQMLEKWLPDIAQEKQVEKAPKDQQDSAQQAVDASVLASLLGTEDSDMLTDFYQEFLKTSTPTTEQMRHAFDQSDLTELGSQAHKLKSSARAVGANSLAECCLALEMAAKEANVDVADQQMKLFITLYNQVEEWINQYDKE